MGPQKKNLLPEEKQFHFTCDLTYALVIRNQGDAVIVSPPKGTHRGLTPNEGDDQFRTSHDQGVGKGMRTREWPTISHDFVKGRPR